MLTLPKAVPCRLSTWVQLKRHWSVRWIYCACALVALVSCGIHGPTGPAIAPRTVRLGAGLELLAEYEAPEFEFPGVAVANDREALGELWKSARLAGDPPQLDFSRVVIVAYAQRSQFSATLGGPHCFIDGLHLTAHRRMETTCVPRGDFAISIAQGKFVQLSVFALSRAALPSGQVVLREDDSQATIHIFGKGTPPETTAKPIRSEPARSQSFAAPWKVLGEASVPSAGNACIARLRDGAHCWVVHHASGEVSVIAGDYTVKPTHSRVPWRFAAGAVRELPKDIQVGDALWGYRRPTSWDFETRSFDGLYDEHGSPIVTSLEPIDHYEFQEIPGIVRRVAIGRRAPSVRRSTVTSSGYWPSTEPRGTPAYSAFEYEQRPLQEVLHRAAPSGQVVFGDLVGMPDGKIHLCPSGGTDARIGTRANSDQIFLRRLPPGCGSSAPIIHSAFWTHGNAATKRLPAISGPFLVFASDGRVDQLIAVRSGSGYAAQADFPVHAYCDLTDSDAGE